MQAFLGWILRGLVVSMPVLLLRGSHPGLRAFALALAYVVPPVGLRMPCTPALVIGLLFPGSGLLGIGLYGVAAAATALMAAHFLTPRPNGALGEPGRRKTLLVAAYATYSSIAFQLVASTPLAPQHWRAMQTNFGVVHSTMERVLEVSNIELPNLPAKQLNSLRPTRADVWFYAEGMVNEVGPATAAIWASKLADSGVLAVPGIKPGCVGYGRLAWRPAIHEAVPAAHCCALPGVGCCPRPP